MANKFELVKKIEKIAPLETAEIWDNCGWQIEYKEKTEVNKVMLCLTVTQDILSQAQEQNCDMIISHHPLFTVPMAFNRGIEIYSAHTNLDKAQNGTTETLISKLGFTINETLEHDFLRFVDVSINAHDLLDRLKNVSKNIRYSGFLDGNLTRIAFCAGSGSEFWHDAKTMGAEVLVTGDLKFHTALDSEISIVDIGHFESEIQVLSTLRLVLGNDVEIMIAKEKSPIVQI